MNNLKTIRKKAGLTSFDLAREMGCTRGSIGHYETGRRLPDIKVAQRLVASLNNLGAECSIEEVFPSETGAATVIQPSQ
ncbi:helix-turn-helix transcriptional regulator [Serratia fonticola]|uniref:helix-turn-helix transcriptional regulator n=1 Tax=Serratia fonticola TaxID=47917 RepID=UPI0013780680|nr:helix-turn-helix transcriptional regulator [Serratia fonticola]NCG55150.1 helix-turn-helix domain-containing protein [Serratia fonticola]